MIGSVGSPHLTADRLLRLFEQLADTTTARPFGVFVSASIATRRLGSGGFELGVEPLKLGDALREFGIGHRARVGHPARARLAALAGQNLGDQLLVGHRLDPPLPRRRKPALALLDRAEAALKIAVHSVPSRAPPEATDFAPSSNATRRR